MNNKDNRNKKLVNALEEWRAILDTIEDAVLLVDLEGRILRCNRAMKDLIGEPFQLIIGHRYHELLAGISELIDICPLRRIRATRKRETISTLIGNRWFDITVDPVLDDEGNVIGAVHIITDTTEHKKAERRLTRYRYHLEELVEERTAQLIQVKEQLHVEIPRRKQAEEKLHEQQRKLSMVQKFGSIGLVVGGMVHNFNNLLTRILGNINLAKMNSKPGSDIFEALTNAEKSSEQVKGLIKRLFTFFEEGEPVKETITIRGLLKDAVTFVVSGSKAKAVFSLPDNLWLVDCNVRQISEAFNNVIFNAVQAMPEGGTITISAENVTVDATHRILPKQGKYVKISIKDEGVGIPSENLPKLFDPYFTTKEKGTGLGLAITHFIIKKHEGYIGVQSEEGVGTIVTIYLPASEKKSPERTKGKKF